MLFSHITYPGRQMDRDKLLLLRDEAKRYKRSRFPKDIRALADSAVQFLDAEIDSYVAISDPECPVVRFVLGLQQSPKCAKEFGTYSHVVIQAIAGLVFKDEALSRLTRSMCKSISSMNFHTCHELVSYLQSLAIFDFPSNYQVQSAFSFALAMMGHTDPTISGVAYAAFQQLLDLLTEKIETANEGSQKKFQAQLTEIVGPVSESFQNPLVHLLYFIFDDLSRISMHDSMRFLVIEKGPEAMIFDVFETL